MVFLLPRFDHSPVAPSHFLDRLCWWRRDHNSHRDLPLMSYCFRFVRLRDSGVAADAAGIGGGGAEDLLRGKVAVNGGDDRELADPSLFSNLL